MLSQWTQCDSDGAQVGLVSPCGSLSPQLVNQSVELVAFHPPSFQNEEDALSVGRSGCCEVDRQAPYLL